MSDRTLVEYEEERLPEGPHWTLEVQRSAAGHPGLFFTIKSQMHDPKYQGVEALNREMTILVTDGWAVIDPILEWLESE